MAPRPRRSEEEPPVRLKRPGDDLLLAIVLMLCGIGSLFATATSLHSWSLAPLLFLGLCSAAFDGKTPGRQGCEKRNQRSRSPSRSSDHAT